MSFLKPATSFTRFKINDEIPSELWSQIADKLRQYAFRDIDEIPEERSLGWVTFEDMLDTLWNINPPQKGNYITFSLRLDTRRVPPAVIKKHLAIAIKKEDEQNRERGKSFISRDRKKELKEQVMLKLKMRFLPVPAEFNTVWNTDTGIIYFASTQPKMLDMFQEYFTTTFNLHLEPLTPYSLAATMLDEKTLEKLDRLESSNFSL